MTGLARREMTADHAEHLVGVVTYHVGKAWRALEELHAGQGWLLLGYPTFEELVDARFAISKRRAHQLVAHGRVVRELESSVSPGLPGSVNRGTPSPAKADESSQTSTIELDLPERATRDLAPVLDDVKAEIRTRLADSDNPAAEYQQRIVAEVVDDYRQRLRSPGGTTQTRRESTTPAAGEAARSSTARGYLDQQPSVQRARYAVAFTGAVARAARMFSEFDQDQVADTLGGDATTMGTVHALRLAADDWFARLAQARKPDLRVLPGGDRS